jgi:hypothetical protein
VPLYAFHERLPRYAFKNPNRVFESSLVRKHDIEILHRSMVAGLFAALYLWEHILLEREYQWWLSLWVDLDWFTQTVEPAREFSLDNLLPSYAFHQSKYTPVLAPNRAKIINSLPLYGRFFNILPRYGFN